MEKQEVPQGSFTRKIEEEKKKSEFYLGVSNRLLTFAHVKNKKDNEGKFCKYILVVASITTPTAVREQCSYVYM